MSKKRKNKDAVQETVAEEIVAVEETVEPSEEAAVSTPAEVSDETIVVGVEETVGSVVAEMLADTESSEYPQEPEAAELTEEAAEEAAAEEDRTPRTPWYKTLWKWAVRLRSVPLAIPVIVIMIILAMRSAAVLPDAMLIGDYELTKQVAVFAPVAATSLSLLMMFISKRIFYPWLISIFTLVLPIFIQFVAPFF